MHTRYVDCANFHCPSAQAHIRASKSPHIFKDDALCDATGTYWCHACKARYSLMNYGAAAGYPALVFPPYAVGQGQMLWRILAAPGTPACIEAWAATPGLDGQEEEEAE